MEPPSNAAACFETTALAMSEEDICPDKEGNKEENILNEALEQVLEMQSVQHSKEASREISKQVSVAVAMRSVDVEIKNKLESMKSCEQQQQQDPQYSKTLFVCYLLICSYYGCLESLPGCLFGELIKQLNISETEVASIFISRAITFTISSIIAAYVIDQYVSTHRYISIILLISSICIFLIPYINYIYIQYILWTSLGFASGLIDVAIPVYTFRGFPDSQKMWFIFITCYGSAKTLIPLIVQISITTSNTSAYSLFFISAISLIGSILIVFLPTPKHDALRSIEKEMAKTDTLRNAESVLKELEQHKTMRNVIIILFGLILVTFGVIQSGLVTFITFYVKQYLNRSDVMGRYLISTYNGGQLFYRFAVAFCLCGDGKKHIHSTIYLFSNLIICYTVFILSSLFWIYGSFLDSNKTTIPFLLFIVYSITGFVSSATHPAIYELCETITPINGTISCIFTMAIGVGDLMIVLIMSQLIQYFGATIYPFPLITAAIIQIFIIITLIILYNKYKSYESVILAAKTRKLSDLQKSIPTLHSHLSQSIRYHFSS